MSWLPTIRLSRIEHNHIFQSDNGIADCPACEGIDPYHLTEHHFDRNYRQNRENHGGGWQ